MLCVKNVLTFVHVNVYYVVQYVLPLSACFLNVLCIDVRVLLWDKITLV
jgi:hypothetical protein